MDNLSEFYQPTLAPRRENNYEKNTENEIIRNCLKSKFFDKLNLENLDLEREAVISIEILIDRAKKVEYI